jgi:hypothetical protein
MLTKKQVILVTIGLGCLVDILLSTVINLITSGEWAEMMYSNPILAIVICILVYGGTYKYCKSNFMK